MDTLEFRTEQVEETADGFGKWKIRHPVVWRGKTPQQVHKEQYPDHRFVKREGGVPISMRPGAEYCASYEVAPCEGDKRLNRVYATLVAVPEKK